MTEKLNRASNLWYPLFTCIATVLLLPPSGLSLAAATAEQKKAETNINTVMIMAAGSGGTYLPFAENLQNVLDDPKGNSLRVVPVIGRGGGQNLLDLLFLRGIDMAITQQEQLAYLKKQDPALYANIENKIYYITKLYDSEFHLLAKND